MSVSGLYPPEIIHAISTVTNHDDLIDQYTVIAQYFLERATSLKDFVSEVQDDLASLMRALIVSELDRMILETPLKLEFDVLLSTKISSSSNAHLMVNEWKKSSSSSSMTYFRTRSDYAHARGNVKRKYVDTPIDKV